MDLETLLQNFGYKKVFRRDGTLSVSGAKAYGKLLDIVYSLNHIGVISDSDTNHIVNQLDMICD